MKTEKAGATILFIDDDDDLAYALSRILEREGYSVRRAPDAAHARFSGFPTLSALCPPKLASSPATPSRPSP